MKNGNKVLILSSIIVIIAILVLAVGCHTIFFSAKMSDVTLAGARLTWDAVDGADEYYVNVMFSEASGYEIAVRDTKYLISHTASGDYYYKVRARVNGQFTNYSKTMTYHLGDGSLENPITVGSIEELQKITTGLRTIIDGNGDTVSVPSYYMQTNDIDLESNEWTPIGKGSQPFKGVFDGGGYNITGLKITTLPSSTSNVATGFFGLVKDAVIKNINIIEPNIKITHAVSQFSVGALIGRSEESAVKNCSVNGNLVIDAPAAGENILYAGLVIGESRAMTGMSNLTARGSLNAIYSRVYAGGIIGITKSNSDIINNCLSYVNVISHGTGRTSSKVVATSYAGGIAGYLSYANSIEYCYYSGMLEATAIDGAETENINKGMFAGAQNSNGRCNFLLKQCYFNIDGLGIEHDETDKTPEEIQAMYTSIAENYTVGNCSKLNTGSSAYGVTNEDEGLAATYAGFDFEKVWTIVEGKPALSPVVLPTVPEMSEITQSGAVISWEAVAGASEYYVYNVDEKTSTTVYNLSYTIPQTAPGTYRYQVYAKTIGELTEYSDIIVYVIEANEQEEGGE